MTMNKANAEKNRLKGFLEQITCHAFNADRTMVAVCPGTHEVFIYDCTSGTDCDKWVKLHTLSEHSGLVSSLDWSPVTNQIVSCGHDRNAYVWKYESDEWKPTLCVLRIQRAAIYCKWSPSGTKFAVSSGSKNIAVCSYEESSNWWVSRLIKKHKSTILDIKWSPNSRFLVTSSTDMRCRIVSAFDNKLDSKDSDYDNVFDEKQYVFGEVLAEFEDAKGWVNTCAWSPNGRAIAFAGHGSTVHYVELNDNNFKVNTLYLKDLPFLAMEFINDNLIVGVGFDRNPAFITVNNGNLAFKTFAEKPEDKKETTTKSSLTSKAFAMFQQADNLGKKVSDSESSSMNIFTTHKNTITDLCLDSKNRNLFTTSGLDGRIVYWDSSKY